MRNVDKDHLFACLSSGTWKYSNFKHGAPWKIIERVLEGLDEADEVYPKNLWEQYWKETLNQGPMAIPDELNVVIERQAEWLYCMRAFHTMMQAAYLYHGRKEISTDEYRNGLKLLKAETLDFIHKCRDKGNNIDFKEEALFERIESETLKPAELRRYCLKNMEAKILEANDILTSIDCLVRPYGELRTLLEYDTIVMISWNSKESNNDKIRQDILEVFSENFKKLQKARNVSSDSIGIVQSDFHCIENNLMIGGYSPQMLSFLVYFACEIHAKFSFSADITTTIFFDLPTHSLLRRPKGTTEYFGHFLWNNMKKVEKFVKGSACLNSLMFVSPGRNITEIGLPENVRRKLGNVFAEESQRTDLVVEENCDFQLMIEKFELNPVMEELVVDRCVDVGIVAIVSDEMRAVNDYLKVSPGYQSEVPGEHYDLDFTLGSMQAKDNQQHSVACVQALSQGNTSVMPAYQALAEEYNPRLIVLLGIGGSVHEKLEICDVCIADQIINYEKRAETPDGPQHTFDPLPPIEPWLVRIFQRLERELGEGMILNSCDGSIKPVFKTRMGPIGSGEAVVKDEDSHVREWLKVVSRKTQAVETEAAGAARQFQSDKLKKSSRTRGYLVIRGISDAAGVDKDKEYRYVPAMNAMIFLGALLKKASKGFKEELGE